MDWSSHCERCKNSVLQLKVIKTIYKPNRPYSAPDYQTISGSGFIVDIERGYVGTSADIVSNSVSITGKITKLGKRDLSLELIGISTEKGLALCKINHDDIKLITRGIKNDESIDYNMKFGDNLEIKETDEIMSVGYPLDENRINYNICNVVGFKSSNTYKDGDIEDAKERLPSYIQIDNYIEEGKKGGPVINKKGEVIGINSFGMIDKNIGYVIPSRTFLSIYPDLVKSTIVKIPTLSLEWNRTNRELMKYKTSNERTYGIYVRKVNPDSCLDQLEEGDIIKRLNYNDPFWANAESFCVYNHEPHTLHKNNKIEILCYFDRYGDADVGIKNPDTGGFQKLIKRKLSFSEIMDMIPIGSDISIEICRNEEWYLVKSNHIYIESNRLTYPYSRCDFEIFAGLCCSNLNMNHVKFYNKKYDKYKRQVIICQVFPDTEASKTQSLSEGQIIKELNNNKIETLDDIRKILRNKPEIITIKTNTDCFFMTSTETIIPEDKRIMKNYNIYKNNYILDSEQTQ